MTSTSSDLRKGENVHGTRRGNHSRPSESCLSRFGADPEAYLTSLRKPRSRDVYGRYRARDGQVPPAPALCAPHRHRTHEL